MSDEVEPSGELRKKEQTSGPVLEKAEVKAAELDPDIREAFNARTVERPTRAQLEFEVESAPKKPASLPFDPARVIDALVQKWYLWSLTGLLLAGAVFYWYTSKPHTMATMQLIRRDVPILFRASDAGDAFKPRQLADQTLMNLVRSPEVFQRVSARTQPRIPLNKLGQILYAVPEKDTELVSLYYKGADVPVMAINLLNLFAEEIVRFTREMQAREGQEVAHVLGEKLASIETNLAAVQVEMKRIPPEMKFTDPDKQTEAYLIQLNDLEIKYEMARIEMEVNNPVAEKLQTARDDLATLLLRYTEAHPLVRDQQAKVSALEKQFAGSTNATLVSKTASTNAINPNIRNKLALRQLEEIKALRERIQGKLNALSEKNVNYVLIKNRYQSLEMLRMLLLSRQREAELYAQNAVGYYEIYHRAGLEHASNTANLRKLAMLVIAAGCAGMAGTAFLIILGELLSARIKTVGDLGRVTGVPVLATLGNLSKMNEKAMEAWAFRTWTILRGKISENQNRALVCGLISAQHGEGRSTWIRLLAKTAHQRGLRVLVAATRPSPDPPLHPHERSDKKDADMKMPVAQSVVAFPFQAAQQLSDPKSHTIVHIPLPGWVWNLERRQQWQAALVQWLKIEDLVFLVELPPASEPESVLLAENLPQLIWLADSGKAKISETREHMETLRHAGCNLVGAILNREPPSFYKKHIARWFGGAGLALALSFNVQAQTEDSAKPGMIPPASSVVETPTVIPSVIPARTVRRAAWQKQLTLGPGDILTLGFFGETNLTKNEVPIGMDGRISYLQAHDVLATGLTVDQLREVLNTELAKFYRTPRVIVTPVAYHSKKYFIMGRVTTKGAYVLDRPVTILEAVSRARGLEMGIADRNSVDLVDLARSFLLRQGQRVPVDFEKLFQEGDFAQNLLLEPNDFLYFAPATLNEVYVLGQVRAPGITPFTTGASVVRVIAERGGFTESAYKRHVLVIRGSLSHPKTFIVNTWAVLDAREADFKLQPRDIIYVSKRPFLKAEELLDLAATSFLESAVTAWSGANIGPIIGSPFVPEL